MTNIENILRPSRHGITEGGGFLNVKIDFPCTLMSKHNKTSYNFFSKKINSQ